MSDPIRKHIRTAVLGLAVLTLSVAPAAAAATHAAQPDGGDSGIFAVAWSRLADLGDWLATAVGLSSGSEEPAPADPVIGLLPDGGENTQCSGECTEDDSGPTMDPDG